MSDFILYANKINSSKGSHLLRGHHQPSAHFLCRLRRRKFHNISLRREGTATLRGDHSRIKFGCFLLSVVYSNILTRRYFVTCFERLRENVGTCSKIWACCHEHTNSMREGSAVKVTFKLRVV